MDTIKLKGVVMEDFSNYKSPSLFLITSICDWKCCTDAKCDISICQNSDLAQAMARDYVIESLYYTYLKNDITKSIVIGGLEPMLQFEEVYNLIKCFREKGCEDDIVIYTGYYKDEILDKISLLSEFKNVIIKFGRFIPNQERKFDAILGVELVSPNQYAERIS